MCQNGKKLRLYQSKLLKRRGIIRYLNINFTLHPLKIGHPTILINNAGVVQGKLICDLTSEDVNQYDLSSAEIDHKNSNSLSGRLESTC